MFHPSAHISPKTLTKLFIMATTAVLAVGISSCKKTPEGVIGEEDMAQLMADVHMGEAVVDFNYSQFPSDSTRKALKQSIYAMHGVTAEQVDTSFVWYGNHIEEYIKVYDRTIDIIEERRRNYTSATNAQISASGDSILVWEGPQRLLVSKRMPSHIVHFEVQPDSTWRNGDMYILSYKLINSSAPVVSRLLVDYADGTTSYVDDVVVRNDHGTLKLPVDSALTPVRLYGFMKFEPEQNTAYEVDSMSLSRLRRELCRNVVIRPKTFDYGIKPELNADDENESIGMMEADVNSMNGVHTRRAATSVQHRQSHSSANLPQASSATNNSSSHRDDAAQHKPTAEQRREVARQHSVAPASAPVKRRKIGSQQAPSGTATPLKK